MAREFVEVLDVTASDIQASNTTTEIVVYSKSIIGGTLGNKNTLRLQLQCKLSLNSIAAVLTLRLKYGATIIASTTIQVTTAPQIDKALLLEALLSGDGSSNLQIGHLSILAYGVQMNLQSLFPVGSGFATEESGNDLNLALTAQFNQADANNEITMQHAALEKISFVDDPVPAEPAGLNTQVLTLSLLNRITYPLRNKVIFYAPLEMSLDIMGIEPVIFTRATPSTAVWRDGASHAVAINEPRFQWQSDLPRGLLINTINESLQFSNANQLHDGNTLFWIEEGAVKDTSTAGNPINAAGFWQGNSNVHIRRLLKFDKVLSADEIQYVRALLSAPDL